MIGILTFHHTLNYGGMLQAYALRETLRSMGKSAEIIDYQTATADKYYFSKIRFWDVRTKIKKRRFRDFIADGLSPTVRDVADLHDSDYDTLIVGSDAVWNTSSFRGYDPAYFLGFPTRNKVRRVSYAASSTGTKPYGPQADEITGHLQAFDLISVRDEATRQRIAALVPEKPIEIVADPSLLYPWGDWLARNDVSKQKNPAKYVLIDVIGGHGAVRSSVSTLVNKYGLRAHSVRRTFTDIDSKRFAPAGPGEWVKAVAGADWVITDSYHATLFCLMLKRKFIWLPSPKSHDKFSDLWTRLDLTHVLARYETREPMWFGDMDFDAVHQRLEEMRKHSLDFLSRALHADLEAGWR